MKDEMLFAEFVASLDDDGLREFSEFFEDSDDIERKVFDNKVKTGGLKDERD